MIIIGKGNHSRVVCSYLTGEKIGCMEISLDKDGEERDCSCPFKFGDDGTTFFDDKLFIIAIGDNKVRKDLYLHIIEGGRNPVSVIGKNVIYGGIELFCGVNDKTPLHTNYNFMGLGTFIGTGVIINTGSKIGNNVIVNTGAIIEHDCKIEDHSFIGPGAILCGNVTVKEGSFIGAGAIICPKVTIGEGVLVKAGQVVSKDIKGDEFIEGRRKK